MPPILNTWRSVRCVEISLKISSLKEVFLRRVTSWTPLQVEITLDRSPSAMFVPERSRAFRLGQARAIAGSDSARFLSFALEYAKEVSSRS
jgi:hypothetical protein